MATKKRRTKGYGRDKEDGSTSKTQSRRSEGKDNRDQVQRRSQHSALNDISWYSRYPELVAAAASVPLDRKSVV